MPLKKGLIRGNSILSGYYVQRKGEGCSLTYVSQVDLKGILQLWYFVIICYLEFISQVNKCQLMVRSLLREVTESALSSMKLPSNMTYLFVC